VAKILIKDVSFHHFIKVDISEWSIHKKKKEVKQNLVYLSELRDSFFHLKAPQAELIENAHQLHKLHFEVILFYQDSQIYLSEKITHDFKILKWCMLLSWTVW
jgi:hypothetical protein